MVERFLSAWELAEDEELLQFARVRGDAMRRLAESGIAFYDTVVNLHDGEAFEEARASRIIRSRSRRRGG